MNIGEYELESPLINGGGVVKTLEDVKRMSETGVGAVLGGSFTLDGRVGLSPNGETVYYHDPDTGITYNSLSMPNIGLKPLMKFLPEMIQVTHDAGKPFILNIAPVSDDPVEEIISMFDILERAKIENLDAVELNASCPNVVLEGGERHELLSHHPQLLGEVLLMLNDIKLNEVPFGTTIVRVSPFKRPGSAVELAEVLKATGTNAVSAFNTFPGGVPTDDDGRLILQVPGGAGGKSGRGMTMNAEIQTRWLANTRRMLRGEFDIIGSNGIFNGASIKRRLDIDPNIVKAVSATTLFWESQSWGNAVRQILQEYAELV